MVAVIRNFHAPVAESATYGPCNQLLAVYINSTLMILFLLFMYIVLHMYLQKKVLSYEARVRFGTRVRDSAIFKKGGCGCGRTRRLKNY